MALSPDGRYLYWSEDVSPGDGFEYNKDPYGVIYAIEADHVLIVSVMHLHRHPESWRKNL